MKKNQGLEEEQERVTSQHHLNGSLEVGFPFPFPHACRNLMNLELGFHLWKKEILGFYEIE